MGAMCFFHALEVVLRTERGCGFGFFIADCGLFKGKCREDEEDEE